MKKFFFSTLTVVSVSLSAWGGYITYAETPLTSDQLLSENIEALSYDIEEVVIYAPRNKPGYGAMRGSGCFWTNCQFGYGPCVEGCPV